MTDTSLHPMPLVRVTNGTCAHIAQLDVDLELRQRLIALGLQVGKTIQVIRRGAFGGPLHVRVGTTEVILRRKEASHIRVTPTTAFAA